jgi:hypothetical protein
VFGLIWKTVVVAVGCLIAADIAGALVVTLVDIVLPGANSPAFAYAVWLVFGVFCGLFIYSYAGGWSSPKPEAGDWTATPGSTRLGTRVFIIGLVAIVGVGLLLYATLWSRGIVGEDYVPDSEPHSIVFLLSVIAGMAAGRFMLMSDPEKAGPKSST